MGFVVARRLGKIHVYFWSYVVMIFSYRKGERERDREGKERSGRYKGREREREERKE